MNNLSRLSNGWNLAPSRTTPSGIKGRIKLQKKN